MEGASNLDRLLSPRAIAVVGASANPARIGGQPLHALRHFGYTGRVFAVNPKYAEIGGEPCYSSVAEIPEYVDVAIVAIGAPWVPDAIRACGERGVSHAIVLSAGFGEVGEAGVAPERALRAAIEETGVRVVGPNCQGILGFHERVYAGFGALFQNASLAAGRLAMVTQSGGFGYAVAALAEQAGLGFSHVISTGNEIDLTSLDFLEHLLERDDVDALAFYLEGVVDGTRLRCIGVRALELGKPIFVWKVGNSPAGRDAARSHTGSMTGEYAVYRAAFREGGFVEVRDVDNLVDLARAFAARRLPQGSNVGVVSISGGAGVLLADRCDEAGLRLPSLGDATLRELRSAAPSFSSLRNPFDVTAQVFNDVELFERITTTVVADSSIDQAIIYNASVQGAVATSVAAALTRIFRATDKPVTVGWSPRDGQADDALAALDAEGIPRYPTPGRAAAAAAALHAYSEQVRRRERTRPPTRIVARRKLAFDAEGATLSERRSKECLAAYGVPVVGEVAITVNELDTLETLEIPFPAVVKVDSPDIAHKTEAGAVRIGLRNREELVRAAHEVLAAARRYAPSARIDGVLVQEVASGIEAIVGGIDDPTFGPVVAFGLGGVFTEVLGDIAYRFAPFGVEGGLELIDEIAASPVLRGLRGTPPVNLDALADVLSRVSLLLADHAGQITELDINPLFCRADGVVAADALIVLRRE